MKYMVIISPGYLHAVKTEIDKLERKGQAYSFKIQGYRKVSEAIKILNKINIKDILGFIYIDDRLPKNTDNLRALRLYLMSCDVMCKAPKRMLFTMHSTTGVTDLVQSAKLTNLKVLLSPCFETVSDKIVKGSIGIILSTMHKPYTGMHEEDKESINENSSLELYENPKNAYLTYSPIVPREIELLYEPVNILGNEALTTSEDRVLRLLNEDNIFYKLRDAYIKAHFGREIEIKSLIDCCMDDVITWTHLLSYNKKIENKLWEVRLNV